MGCSNSASKSPATGDMSPRDKGVESVSVNNINSSSTKSIPDQNLALLSPDIKHIKEKGKLVVAMFWQDRPPFFYSDQAGNLVGIDVNLAKDIAKYLAVDVEFDRSSRSFEEVVNKVVQGQADLGISKLSVTLARAQRASFTQPYVSFQQGLLVNRLLLESILQAHAVTADATEQIINTSQKIGVLDNTSYVEYAEILFPNAKIIKYNSLPELIAAVRSGEILAVLYDENELNMQINQSPDLLIYTKLFILKNRVDQIAIAVAPDNTNLLAWLNTYLTIMKKDQVVQQIVQNYSKGVK
ncbi:MAG: hypothetical protein APF81_20665 [Desulfosporosinus sp. BRH_c37]|nr:MAG: hypothetical protein APF81_20665 [Desulfosporosinus sp. BRH_c37]